MRQTLFLLSALCLVGCSQSDLMPIDAQKILGTLDGPKVPTMQDTMLESAKNAEKQGDYKQAAQYYQQILSRSPDNKEVALALAESYRRGGDYDRAIALYDSLIAKDAAMLGAKEGKGLALMAKGDFDTPATLFDEVMKADPKRWKTLNALGILFVTRGMYPEAQQYFTEALKFSPSNPSILNNMGLSQALNRDHAAAISSLMQASALTGTGTAERRHVDLNLALVYAVAGKLDAARALTEVYFSGAALNNNLGLYAHLSKDDQLAKAYLNMALTESKTFYEKAWDNLQTLNNNTPASGPTPARAPEPQSSGQFLAPPQEPGSATVLKPITVSPKKSSGLGSIVNKSDDTPADKKQ